MNFLRSVMPALLFLLLNLRGYSQEMQLDIFIFKDNDLAIKEGFGSLYKSDIKYSLWVARDNKLNNRSIDSRSYYDLENGNTACITSYFDTIFLYQEFARQSDVIIHQGYLVRGKYIYDSVWVEDPETGERFALVDTSYQVLPTGAWRHRVKGLTYEIGNYSNGLKEGLWYIVNVSVPDGAILEEKTFRKGKIVSRSRFDFSSDKDETLKLLRGEWFLYLFEGDNGERKENSPVTIAMKKEKGGKNTYIGTIIFIDDHHLQFLEHFSCGVGVDIEKERAVRIWNLSDNNTIAFDDYRMKIKFISKDKMLLK